MEGIKQQVIDALTGEQSSFQDMESLIRQINNPEWPTHRYSGDWVAAIPESVREIWDELTLEARVIAFIVANRNKPLI